MTIYCEMTECVFRKELDEPHERDSIVPSTYTGVCNRAGIELKNIDILLPTRYRWYEAVCDSYSTDEEVEADFAGIVCDMGECRSNVEGVCMKHEISQNKDVYIKPVVIEGVEYPMCSSKHKSLQDSGRRDWSQYPKR